MRESTAYYMFHSSSGRTQEATTVSCIEDTRETEAMKTKRLLWALTLICLACGASNSAQETKIQANKKTCRIVDYLSTKAGNIYYVDATKVSGDVGEVLLSLRQRERASSCTCLLAFFTASARIRDVEDLRVIAGKMDYKDFHSYLYDPRYSDFATEINYDGTHLNLSELRSGSQGAVPLPDVRMRE